MPTSTETLVALEHKFWQALLEQDIPSATGLLADEALMVSDHGAIKFDHAGYRRMAEQGPMVVKAYELRDFDATFPRDDVGILTYRVTQKIAARTGGKDREQEMNDTSTWVRFNGGLWKCVMHTEAPMTKETARES